MGTLKRTYILGMVSTVILGKRIEEISTDSTERVCCMLCAVCNDGSQVLQFPSLAFSWTSRTIVSRYTLHFAFRLLSPVGETSSSVSKLASKLLVQNDSACGFRLQVLPALDR